MIPVSQGSIVLRVSSAGTQKAPVAGLFSAVIPVRNVLRSLGRYSDSTPSQPYMWIELIVLNDSPADGIKSVPMDYRNRGVIEEACPAILSGWQRT